ncbi:MAG: monofunctional biosynthetic peptidoglycan transglycosylase [Nitratireductor sp.]
MGRIRETRIYKWVLRIIAILVLLPFVLSLLYKFNFINPVSTLMLGRYASLQKVERTWVPLEDIAPVLRNSVIMSEDGKFCAHNGVDWAALNTVIDSALEGEKTRGASTLTMQSVKNLFLWNSRSYIRKGLEVPLALYFDAVLSKRRIMEIYLNIAEWDEGVFGIEAASQKYFKRSAKKLSAKQASLLTVTLPNPVGRNAAKPTKSMRRVANIVAKRARQAGAYVKCLK